MRTRESRVRAAKALHNIVHALPDDKRSRREARVVKLLEQVSSNHGFHERRRKTVSFTISEESKFSKLTLILLYGLQVREFCDALEEGNQESHEDETQEPEHPTSAVAALMKLSFDEEHRHAICQLGNSLLDFRCERLDFRKILAMTPIFGAHAQFLHCIEWPVWIPAVRSSHLSDTYREAELKVTAVRCPLPFEACCNIHNEESFRTKPLC